MLSRLEISIGILTDAFFINQNPLKALLLPKDYINNINKIIITLNSMISGSFLLSIIITSPSITS
jgi:hypothetical protein